MAKRSIEVKNKEKELIDRMNNNVGRWDNNGPVQFEGQDTETTKVVAMDTADGEDKSVLTLFDTKTGKVTEVEDMREPYVEPKVNNDDWKEDYFSGKTVDPMTVSLTPRNYDGSIMENYDDFLDDPEDRKASRESVSNRTITLPISKAIDIEYERLLKKPTYILAIKKALDKIKSQEEVDTRLRTQDNTINVDLPFPGEVKAYEEVNHPQHYNNYDVEVIDMMERVFGKEATITFCKLNAFKYRMRAGTKPNQSAEKDLNKEKWYLDKMRELGNKDE